MQVNVSLKDGVVKPVESGSSCFDIAVGISSSFAKKCIGAVVNGKAVDLSYKITSDSSVIFIVQDVENDESLHLLRHSVAHLMAHAVKELHPQMQPVIGPVIEDGFYYDFYGNHIFSTDDLREIEEKMREIASKNYEIVRKVLSFDEAIDLFTKRGEDFKVKIIKELPNEEISVYSQGDFVDLCRGPHVPSTGFIKYFKLLKVSGSYWRGNSKNAPLQRVYGTAFLKKSSLEEYINIIEEAKNRDHRKIGKEMGLFHQQLEAHGDIFWHPKGYAMFLLIQSYIRKVLQDDYQEVKTPMLVKRKLWEDSGHWEKFQENMFTLQSEDEDFALKPMNCPCHVQIFNNSIHSYKDLPIRMAEFGSCHRYEPSGALHGIMRVRAFTQDDAHIFCTEDQIQEESAKFIKTLFEVYKDFGFENVKIKFSDRPQKRAGDDVLWDRAESALMQAVKNLKYDFELNKGEGAFYGPKLEFVLIDALKREWQCGTLQADFVLPARLGAEYVNHDGKKENCVMLHRAMLGSFERFIGILIEHYAGRMPFWLMPTQVVVCGVTNDQDNDVISFASTIKNLGFRAEHDLSSDTVSYKVRKHSLAKAPYIVLIGKKEVAENTVTFREIGNNNQKTTRKEEFFELLKSHKNPILDK